MRVGRCRNAVFFGGGEVRGVLKLVNDLQISCKVEESGCCVLYDRNYCESYVWP